MNPNASSHVPQCSTLDATRTAGLRSAVPDVSSGQDFLNMTPCDERWHAPCSLFTKGPEKAPTSIRRGHEPSTSEGGGQVVPLGNDNGSCLCTLTKVL